MHAARYAIAYERNCETAYVAAFHAVRLWLLALTKHAQALSTDMLWVLEPKMFAIISSIVPGWLGGFSQLTARDLTSDLH